MMLAANSVEEMGSRRQQVRSIKYPILTSRFGFMAWRSYWRQRWHERKHFRFLLQVARRDSNSVYVHEELCGNHHTPIDASKSAVQRLSLNRSLPSSEFCLPLTPGYHSKADTYTHTRRHARVNYSTKSPPPIHNLNGSPTRAFLRTTPIRESADALFPSH